MREVTIDTLTGEYRVDRVDIVHDVGKSLNPAIDKGQIEGGFIQGMGWLTTEELVWDDQGRLRTHAPSTYKIPTCADRPEILNIRLLENTNAKATIHRSKAVGEPPSCSPSPSGRPSPTPWHPPPTTSTRQGSTRRRRPRRC